MTNGDPAQTDIVFSLADGFVWASWPGSPAQVKLGRYETVRAMMSDFLDQSRVGDRLSQRAPSK